MTEPAAAIDALYALPLDGFISARDALAKELTRAGDKKTAAEVKKLKKPSVPSWTLNQLRRRHGEDVDVFLSASDRLFRAQLRMMAGEGDDDFRAATKEQRAALQVLLDRVPQILSEAGHDASRTFVDRIAKTLRATALDEAARAKLVAGRLVEDLEDGGFDALTAQLGASVAPAPSRPSPAVEARRIADEARRVAVGAEREALRATLAEARDAERAAREHLRAIERAAAELRPRVEEVRKRWDAARAVEAERRAALAAAEADRRIVEEQRDAELKRLAEAERAADEARARVIAATEAAREADRALAASTSGDG